MGMKVTSTFDGSSLGADNVCGVAGTTSSMSASRLSAQSQAKVNWPLEEGILLWGTCVHRLAMRICRWLRPQGARGRISRDRVGLAESRAMIRDDAGVSLEIGPPPPLARFEVVPLGPLVPRVDE